MAVEKARKKAEHDTVTGVSFLVMDAESMKFEDKTFDVVYGSGILHHLNIDKAYRELARVLKPDGVAIFIEPLGHNPLINLYRKKLLLYAHRTSIHC